MPHWTQTPEGRQKLTDAMKKGWDSRRKKGTALAVSRAEQRARKHRAHQPIVEHPPARKAGTQQHELITALEDNGFHDAATFIKGWVARG